MVKFQAVVDGKVVAEGETLMEAIENAEDLGHSRNIIKTRSVKEVPRV